MVFVFTSAADSATVRCLARSAPNPVAAHSAQSPTASIGINALCILIHLYRKWYRVWCFSVREEAAAARCSRIEADRNGKRSDGTSQVFLRGIRIGIEGKHRPEQPRARRQMYGPSVMPDPGNMLRFSQGVNEIFVDHNLR